PGDLVAGKDAGRQAPGLLRVQGGVLDGQELAVDADARRRANRDVQVGSALAHHQRQQFFHGDHGLPLEGCWKNWTSVAPAPRLEVARPAAPAHASGGPGPAVGRSFLPTPGERRSYWALSPSARPGLAPP